jgi:imidazolonepropionase-like amidohydrolase
MDLSLDLLDAADAQGPEYLVKRAAGLVDSGASWIKLMVTGGIGTPCGEVLEPRFSEEEISAVVRAAHSRGAKVMAHVWGGAGLDWVIRAGVDSAEHGVYITGSQAEALALAGIVLVPTAAIYRMIADGPGGNKGEFRRRAARAAEAHPRSIRRARDAGVPIALGTDFGGPGEHGRNLAEIDALVSCGLSRGEAWTAATVTGAALLGRADRIGSVKPGFRADLIIFTADPYKADTGPPGIAGIIASGKLIRAESSLSQGINYF